MKNTYKVSAISAIILIAFIILSVIFIIFWVAIYKNIYPIYPIIVINILLSILYYNGLLKLADQYSSKWLKTGSIMRILITIISGIILIVLLGYFQKDINETIYSITSSMSENNQLESLERLDNNTLPQESQIDLSQNKISEEDTVKNNLEDQAIDPIFNQIKSRMSWVFIYNIIYAIIIFLPEIFIGFGFLNISEEKVKHTKITGILNLIYGFGSLLQLIISFIVLSLITNSMFLPMLSLSLLNYILSIIICLVIIVLFVFTLIILFGESTKIQKANN